MVKPKGLFKLIRVHRLDVRLLPPQVLRLKKDTNRLRVRPFGVRLRTRVPSPVLDRCASIRRTGVGGPRASSVPFYRTYPLFRLDFAACGNRSAIETRCGL